MALNAYLAQVQSLLDDPGAVEYPTANLTTYINDARVQIAGASESIRLIATLSLTGGTPSYLFSLFTGLPASVQGVIALRKMRSQGGPAGQWIEVFNREWEWFWSYCLNGPRSVAQGTPDTFSVIQKGVNGSFFVNPTPAGTLVISADCVGYPINLASDSDPEALPYPWTEAVQYYAAYLALLNAQRYADADGMLQRYVLFETRATQMSTPTALPVQYPGGPGAAIAGAARPITAPGQQPAAGGGG